MRHGFVLVAALLTLLCSARAIADVPGRFDYWVLALSWSPEYCKQNVGDAQCRHPQRYAFVVHGLWPQHERGYPSRCAKRERVPKELVERMLPLMPSAELIQHQWDKHGTCSGLSQEQYFALVERLYHKIEIPAEYREAEEYINTSVDELEKHFIRDNRAFDREGIAVQCRSRYLREVRMCFDTKLNPRACGRDVDDRCRDQVVLRPNR